MKVLLMNGSYAVFEQSQDMVISVTLVYFFLRCLRLKVSSILATVAKGTSGASKSKRRDFSVRDNFLKNM